MSERNSQQELIQQINELFYPIRKFASDPDARNRMLYSFGWNLESIQGFPVSEFENVISQIATLSDDLINLVNNPPESLLELTDALLTLKNLFETLDSIKDLVDGLSGSSLDSDLKNEFKTFAQEFTNKLLVTYFEIHKPKLYSVLTFLGFITPYAKGDLSQGGLGSTQWQRQEYVKREIHLNKLQSFLTDSIQYFKDEFYPSSGVLNTLAETKEFSDKFFPRVAELFSALGCEVWYGYKNDLTGELPPEDLEVLSRTLTILLYGNGGLEIGASIYYDPPAGGDFGLVVAPFGELSLERGSDKWFVQSEINASIEAIGIKSGGLQFPSSFNGTHVGANISIGRSFENGIAKSQLGSVNGTRLEIGYLEFNLFGNFALENVEYGIKLVIDEGLFVIGGGEGDSFINKIFKEPISAEFDIIAGWSNIAGFFFEGSGSLTVAIPVNKEVFGLTLETIYITLKFINGKIIGELSADTHFELGPLTASINRMGIDSELKLEKGNLGLVDLNTKFKPPTGIGLSLDTNIFKGGGFLSFDFEQERYVGALEISVKDKVALKVIGVLTTKLPGNDDGYSLLLLITAEFQPINLGFGFTLNGVGGLIALNRTMNLNYLRDGVKAGTLDNILFPANPIANIQQIISDLEGAFPVQEGRYTFGPMAIIGWGTPTLITIELGLMLEVPSPVRLAILGVLRAILPSENKQLLKLQVNFMGAIDFEAKFITFDASLFESKLLSFTLSGDMVFRLKYGDNNNFLFSIGGFHPAFTPPPLQLPVMKRLTINLLGGDNPRLTLTSYFAVTSNSVQFGSAVDFYYKITNKWSVVGYLGFDILIQFNPFYLNAAIAASLALMKNGNAVVGIYLGGSVSGPAPWHVQGKAELEICGITLKANFDKTFGEPETTTLPDINVLPKIEEALQNKANWQASTPTNNNQLVSVRELNNSPGSVVVHPFGTLGVSQKVVPLGLTINKFGTQRPADFQSFGLEIANSGGTNFEAVNVKDLFAPAEYITMSDSAKLSRKSFEEFNSGVSIKSNDGIHSSYLMERELEFEQIIMDSRQQPEKIGLIRETTVAFRAFTKNGSSAKSSLGTKKRPVSENAPATISIAHERFAIALTEDLEQYNGLEAGSEAEARVLLEQLLEENPALTDQIQVVPLYQVA